MFKITTARALFLSVGLLSAATSVAAAQDSMNTQAITPVTLNPTGPLADGTPSTVTATARFVPRDNGRTGVVIYFSGLQPNTKHAGHFHAGSCSKQGPVVIPLRDVVANEKGHGFSVTIVDTAKIPALTYLNFHQRGTGETGGVGGGITCGDVPTDTTAMATMTVALGPTGPLADGTPSTARATATLTSTADSMTRVVVAFSGLQPNTKHAGHFHAGSCASQGPVVIPLSEVVADASGNGTSTTMVETTKIPALTYLNFHQRGAGETGGVGGGISCGDVK